MILLLCSITVSAQWNSPLTLDATGNTGHSTSILSLNGYVMIAYKNNSSVDLMFVRSTNDTANNWTTPVTVESNGQTGKSPCLIEVNGRPAIAYFDDTQNDLKYVRAADGSGTTWDTIRTVVSAGSVGNNPSMQMVNNAPAISYFKQNTFDLMYVRATQGNGAAWGSPVTVASTGQVGLISSMVIADGKPAIAYYSSTNGMIMYVRANDINGTSWGNPDTVDVIGTGTANLDLSMKIVNGVPAIAYYHNTDKDLKFAYATNAAGSSWNTPITLDVTGNTGKLPYLAVVNGRPAISYYGRYNDLCYIRANNAIGSSWPTSFETVYSTGKVGAWSSLIDVNNKAYISFTNVGSGDLMFINESAVRSKPGKLTGIEVAKSGSSTLRLYPNPTSDKVTVEFTDITEELTIHLINISGSLLKTKKLSDQAHSISFDISDLPNGFYMIKAESAEVNFIQKFMKQ